MKKIFALALAILASVLTISMAEDYPAKYQTWGVGIPNFIMPSVYGTFGQIFNDSAGKKWGLGFGTSRDTNGTAVYTWDSTKASTWSGTGYFAGALTAAGGVVGNITGDVTGNADTATALAADPADAGTGFLCRGINTSGTCQLAAVDDTPANSSTSPVTSNALYDHAALTTGVHGAVSAATASKLVIRDANADVAVNIATAAKFSGPLTGNVTGNSDTATALAADGADAASGFLCRGVSAAGACQEAAVDDTPANSSTSPVTSNALYDHAALTGTSAHSAASDNTASAIVARDGSGNFSAGTITAGLTGNTAGTHTGPATISGGRLILGVSQVGTGTGELGIYSSTTVFSATSFATVISSGGPVTITALPSISTTTTDVGATGLTSGTYLLITSTAVDSDVIFQDNGTLSGSRLQLGAATRTVGQYDVLELVFSAVDSFWREISYTDN